jgi:hypothetical protein
MAVMAREAWTDERLDDLNQKVDNGFEEMRTEFQAVRGEMREEFQAVRSEMREEFQAVRSEIQSEFQAVRGEIRTELQGFRGELGEIRTEMGALNRTVIQFAWAVVGTMFLSSMGTIAALITLV